MMRYTLLLLSAFLLVACVAHAERDSKAPRVVGTSPVNGSIDVDPSLTEISVTFDEEMVDGSWSWAYEDEERFPRITGQAYYVDNNTKNVLPVKLEPDREYVIWLNTEKFQGFKDLSGNPAVPFKFTFKTAGAP